MNTDLDIKINPNYNPEAVKVNEKGEIIKCDCPYLLLLLNIGKDNAEAFIKMFEDNPKIKDLTTADLYMTCCNAVHVIGQLKEKGIKTDTALTLTK